jgi:hypothetical protein
LTKTFKRRGIKATSAIDVQAGATELWLTLLVAGPASSKYELETTHFSYTLQSSGSVAVAWEFFKVPPSQQLPYAVPANCLVVSLSAFESKRPVLLWSKDWYVDKLYVNFAD